MNLYTMTLSKKLNRLSRSLLLGNLFTILLLTTTITAFSQEKGGFKKNPKINQSKTTAPAEQGKPKEAEDEFRVEQSTIQFQSQFEPVRPINPVVQEDTITIDEGEPLMVEVVDSVFIEDEWVKAADYFIIWDENNINPYGTNPLEFDLEVDLEIYNDSIGRKWSMPLDKTVLTSQFGFRWGRWHTGTDLDLETGDNVYSTFDGIVRVVGFNGRGYGRYVVVRHYNGLETLYAHLSKPLVESGHLVKAGDLIGLGGNTGRSTGSHLHFENRYEGHPFDPRHIFDWSEKKVRAEHFLLTSKVWDFRRGGKPYQSEHEEEATPTYSRTVLHRVRSGDTLTSIARRYGTTISALAKKNNISTRSTLRIGQRIRIR